MAWHPAQRLIDQPAAGVAANTGGRGRDARAGPGCFSRGYLLPFEMVSVLLLVAMVGVVLLSKKDLK